MRLAANVWVPIVITDITTRGCRIEARDGLGAADTIIWLKVANLCSVEAVIKWALPGNVGIEFKQHLHPAVVEHLLSDRKAGGEGIGMTMLDRFGRELPSLGQKSGKLRSC